MKQILETTDGFQWEVISHERAKELFYNEIDEVYILYIEDEAEGLVQDVEDIEDGDNTFALEIGFVKKVKEPEEKMYVLFGESASKVIEGDDLLTDEQISDIKYSGYSVAEYDSSTHIRIVLDDADGWLGYRYLTKEQYDQIAAI